MSLATMLTGGLWNAASADGIAAAASQFADSNSFSYFLFYFILFTLYARINRVKVAFFAQSSYSFGKLHGSCILGVCKIKEQLIKIWIQEKVLV